METPNQSTSSSGAITVKKVSKIIVITPKQIADVGLDKKVKNAIKTRVIGQQIKSGDGALEKKPATAALLENLRTKINTVLKSSPVKQVDSDSENESSFTLRISDDEACDTNDGIIVKTKPSIDSNSRNKVEIQSNQIVTFTPTDLQGILHRTVNKVTKPTNLILNHKLQQKPEITESKSENLLCVPDQTGPDVSQKIADIAKKKLTVESSGNTSKIRPKSISDIVKSKELKAYDLDALIEAKQVLKDAAAGKPCTVPKFLVQPTFRPKQVVRTYSKVNSISVVDNIQEVKVKPQRPGRKRKLDSSDGQETAKAAKRKPLDSSTSTISVLSSEEEDNLTSAEKEMEEKDKKQSKEEVEPITPVAPKKRGRPRKTPLQPKVDVETESTEPTKEITNSEATPTPRKRGRPRKVSAESSEESTPAPIAKKGRRKKSTADDADNSPPTLRTSTRKRKVVDYAALSGGRISSSEDEDLEYIARQTAKESAKEGKKDDNKDDSAEDELEEVEEVQDEKPKGSKSPKVEAVHPLKKRLKLEHAQAVEKEKLEETINEEKSKTPDKTDNEDKKKSNDIEDSKKDQNKGGKAETEKKEKDTKKENEDKECGPQVKNVENKQEKVTKNAIDERKLKENNCKSTADNTVKTAVQKSDETATTKVEKAQEVQIKKEVTKPEIVNKTQEASKIDATDKQRELDKPQESIKSEEILSSKDKCDASSRDKSDNSSKDTSDAASKGKSDGSSKDKSYASSKDKSDALSKDKSDASSKDKSDARSKDKSDALSKDKSELSSNDKSDASSKDKSDASSKDKSEASSKDKFDASSKDKSDTSSKDKSDASSKDESDASSKDKSDASSKDKSDASSKDKSDASSKDKSDVLSKDKCDAWSKNKSDALSKDKSDALSKDNSDASSKDKCGAVPKDKCGASFKDNCDSSSKDKCDDSSKDKCDESTKNKFDNSSKDKCDANSVKVETDSSVNDSSNKEIHQKSDNQSINSTIKVEEPTSTGITCAVCNDSFESQSEWMKHKESQHNNLAWEVGEPALELDNYQLVLSTLTDVLNKHGSLACKICGEDFSTVKKYMRHVEQQCNSKLYQLNPSVKRRNRKGENTISQAIRAILPALSEQVVKNEDNENVTKKPNPTSSDDVTCAICEASFSNKVWSIHKQTKHNNLAWRVGEDPLDLTDEKLVTKTLTILCKKQKFLKCDRCEQKKKSVVGFISHKSQCQKTIQELDQLKIKCHLCHRTMLPVSLPRHIVLSHSTKSQSEETAGKAREEVLTPRRAATRAATVIESLSKEDTYGEKSRKFFKNFNFNFSSDVVKRFNEVINTNSSADCIFETCDYKSENTDDLMQHISRCSKKPSIAYTCNFCLATFGVRSLIFKHLRDIHGHESYANLIITQDVDDKEFDETEREEIDDLEFLDGDKRSKSRSITYTAQFLKSLTKKNQWLLFPQAFDWTMNFVRANYSNENIFPKVILNKDNFKEIETTILQYFPKLISSINVARMVTPTVVNPVDQEHKWKQYKLFDSDVFDDGTSIIFCGGPISSMAWAPTPHTEIEADQILAISVLPDPDTEYKTNEKHLNKSLIQFWNFGPLDNKTISDFKPKLAFCIGHEYGIPFNLEWCPSGCYDVSTDDDKFIRKLGLLAVASGDSSVYIYAVPQCDQIMKKIWETTPIFKLTIPGARQSFYPTTTSWCKAAGHSNVAVGYSDGRVGIYNVRSERQRFEKEGDMTVLYPIQLFLAHRGSVKVLKYVGDGRSSLVTGGVDREVKFWNITSVDPDPTYTFKKSPVTDVACNVHWLTVVASYDSIAPSMQISPREYSGAPKTFLPTAGRITSLTSNDWGNLFMQTTDSGEVSAYFSGQLHDNTDHTKRTLLRSRYLASYTAFATIDMSVDDRMRVEQNRMEQILGQTEVTAENYIFLGPSNYTECKNEYGLIICDMNTTGMFSLMIEGDGMNYFLSYPLENVDEYKNKNKAKDVPAEEFNKFVNAIQFYSMHKPDLYFMQSINKIVLNQNMQSFLYYALGYQVGFVRVNIIRFLNNKNM